MVDFKWFFGFLLVMGFAWIGVASQAQAATVNCTGTQTITTSTAVQFNFTAKTCTILDGASSLSGADDITFNEGPAAAEVFKIGTGGGQSVTAHNGCSIGPDSFAAGVTCVTNRSANATETARITITASDNSTVVMNITYTTVGFTSFKIDAASVTITAAGDLP